MPTRRVLILGGTREARELAGLLADNGVLTMTSLAGVTRDPAQTSGAVRSGGFGGMAGLAAFLQEQRFDAVVDATHPFAAQISKHAAEAASRSRMPIFRLERPPWLAGPTDNWHVSRDASAAVAAIPEGSRILLTVGRKELSVFFSRQGLTGVARMIEPPGISIPDGWTIICARPPFAVTDELALMDREHVTVLVAKNSGGEDTRAKLDAARERRIPVYLIERPHKPVVPTAATPVAVLALLAGLR